MSSPEESDTTPSHGLPYQIRVDQGHLMAAGLMFGLSLIAVAYAPKILFWVPLLPLVFIVWTLRSRTTFTTEGITARYLFRRSSSLAWQDFEALRFTRGGKALAVRTDGTTFPLPGVSFNSLVDLSEVTGGRIPDPVTPGLTAIDESVKVINKDGYAVLMDKDEYDEYEAARRTSRMAREELQRRDEARRNTGSASQDD